MQTEGLYPALVRAGDVVLDIGANIGQTARALSPLVGPHGRCLCFEPEPSAFGRLAALAAEPQYPNVEPHCCALSDEIGYALLFFGRRPDVAQASTIVKDLANVNRLGRQVGAVKIETDTVDHFCAMRSIAPAFMKIDVEGAEDRVLKGAEKVLSTHHPPLVFEFGYGFDGGSVPAHFTALERLGYRLFVVDIMFRQSRPAELVTSDGCLVEISADQILAHQLSGNLLAVPVSQMARIAGYQERSLTLSKKD